MRRERIIWIITALIVAGIGFYGGQIIGSRTSTQNRARAAQQFFSQRGGQAGGPGGGVAGTVTAVSGNTVTLTTRNNQTVTVQLGANGTVRKQVNGQLSDVTTGEQIVAIGTQNGDTFQATSIQI